MSDIEQEAQTEEESTCGRPCDPNSPCDECADYWNRMVTEGYWNRDKHQWTDKGWREITRLI